MWCERVLYNAPDRLPETWEGRQIDYVDIGWDECKRVLKKRSRGGEEVRVLLPLDQRLTHGDVLCDDDRRVLAINVVPAEFIVAGPGPIRDLTELALELGNLHWPTQVVDSQLIFPEHATAMKVIERLGLTWRKENRRFEPAELIASPAAELARRLQVLRRAI